MVLNLMQQADRVGGLGELGGKYVVCFNQR
jgi:hypothetical protein